MFLGFVYNNSFLNVSASVIIVMTRVHNKPNYFINIFHFTGPRINFIRFSSKLKDNKTQTLFLVIRVDPKYLAVVLLFRNFKINFRFLGELLFISSREFSWHFEHSNYLKCTDHYLSEIIFEREFGTT